MRLHEALFAWYRNRLFYVPKNSYALKRHTYQFFPDSYSVDGAIVKRDVLICG